jgi:hypothetical protein
MARSAEAGRTGQITRVAAAGGLMLRAAGGYIGCGLFNMATADALGEARAGHEGPHR